MAKGVLGCECQTSGGGLDRSLKIICGSKFFGVDNACDNAMLAGLCKILPTEVFVHS
jgi:hypothetical protein